MMRCISIWAGMVSAAPRLTGVSGHIDPRPVYAPVCLLRRSASVWRPFAPEDRPAPPVKFRGRR
jgi:hypothetical protein